MRIKLRLYIRDLDLLTLKQNPCFNLRAAIQQALWEYVEYGECSRIRIPHTPSNQVVLKNDQIDVSFTQDKYKKVVEWILSIRSGMRNSAIKAVLRSAIANPDLGAFLASSDVVIPERTAAKIEQMQGDKFTPAANSATPTASEPDGRAESTGAAKAPTNTVATGTNSDGEFDLFEQDFGDQFMA